MRKVRTLILLGLFAFGSVLFTGCCCDDPCDPCGGGADAEAPADDGAGKG